MNTLLRIEKALCTLYVAVTYPFICLGQVWMARIEGQERLKAVLEPMVNREYTVSDIRPAGMVKVHAMGPDGTWDEIHDYPVRLLPKVPGVTIRRGE